MTGSECSIDELNMALSDLNRRLSELNGNPRIQIRAVGGYALMARGIRDNGVTSDIDTVTGDYSPEVMDAIAQVADKYGLDAHWLNNQTVYSPNGAVTEEDVRAFDSELGARYESVDYELSNIDFCIADTETLAKCKAMAVQDIANGFRTTKDAQDLSRILESMGYSGIDEAAADIDWLKSPDFLPCIEIMKSYERGEELAVAPDDDFDLDELLGCAYDLSDSDDIESFDYRDSLDADRYRPPFTER